jgi:hypothetical protein
MRTLHDFKRWAVRCCSLSWLLVAWPLAGAPGPVQAVSSGTDFHGNQLSYANTEAIGPVADLKKQLDQGTTNLTHHPDFGYLLSALDALGVPQSSQLLVFSKTSCQRERISPKTPRAIYFNDRVYVAWIPGSPLLELSCVDPQLGAVFYTLDQKESPRPRISRRDQCLECHTSHQTLGVPGYLVRSYATDTNGTIDITDGYSMVDHRTPFAERWGGWYVCGASGTSNRAQSLQAWNQSTPAALNLETAATNRLAALLKYPHPTSDVAALLVLEHQAEMQNFITRLQYRAAANLNSERADAPAEKSEVEAFIKYLLFTDEAAWSGPVQSTSGFAAWFESQGPRDKQGRSLRQLELHHRLFKLPCSYMIYSDAFDALPRSVRLQVYRRLWNILTGEDTDPAFARIPAEAKRAILEILIETKADIPVYWTL